MTRRGQAHSKELTAETVGARFKAARERAGVSIETAAGLAGLKPDRLRKLEAGKAEPTLTEMLALGKAVGLDIQEVVLSPEAQEVVEIIAASPENVRRGLTKVIEGVAEAYNLRGPGAPAETA